ncbi:hypothetical protein [Desulfotruncus alcoholivorax]|uniref:hypothetical protein n=1 Tax=Desulfotruncus alcoholivorax TaxID=265477 RepID=UPI000487C1A6|nr:hypothetical protein [Desulfotruncus alcoholivorax]
MDGFKTFYLSHACKDLLRSCYTKADIKGIDNYASCFPTHEAVDLKRLELKHGINNVINQLKSCINEHQMRKVIKSQPIDIKFFLFERLAVISTVLDKNKIDAVKIESTKPIGLAFAEAIDNTWQIFVDPLERKGLSVSEFSLSMIR